MVINMFVESMYEGELKKQKERFLESILFALSVKFDEITDILKQKILSLSANNFDLQNYKNIIRSSNSAEEAYSKIAKLV